ncbi:hypothetical protein JQ633_13560 [Bradyrhizobium tropiciagri]|uniref:hypothetical protein n=1 Tax=Bradyrhizobium tropiciagri TaxID=312253 RepID=UPI001BA6A3E0|nr:hypothetical protein [Bradyrhizobium tropiciagri]MBR0871389.1 hypothetical protein [Bradyrhizobium tropiciagri]
MDKKRRNRVKQNTSLAFRLRQLADAASEKANALPLGRERERLLKKVREAQRALEVEAFLKTPGADFPL